MIPFGKRPMATILSQPTCNISSSSVKRCFSTELQPKFSCNLRHRLPRLAHPTWGLISWIHGHSPWKTRDYIIEVDQLKKTPAEEKRDRPPTTIQVKVSSKLWSSVHLWVPMTQPCFSRLRPQAWYRETAPLSQIALSWGSQWSQASLHQDHPIIQWQ